jgi:hypothetical protein|tara:strand:+ start:787 stop:1212 length:426 start_codon:yes stop_codon:yes gene_type:complete
MVKENSFGLIKALTTVISSKTTSMDRVSISGLMGVFTTDNGSTTKWKDKVLSHGVMGVDTKETTKMIRNMVTVPSSGQMAENISVNGAKANSMVKVFTLKRAKRDKVSGRWEKELSGSRLPRPTNDHNKFSHLYKIIFHLF